MQTNAHLACLLVALLLGPVWAAPQVDLPDGTFFEAEDYDELLRGDGFAQITLEPVASAGKMLTGMFKPGAISYRLTIAAAGTYVLWLRAAAPGEVKLRCGFDTAADAALTTAEVPKTRDKLDAPDAYQWARLGEFELTAGEHTFVLGQGALRPDCFFLTTQTEAQVADELLDRVIDQREAPKGPKLPELVHERAISHHPGWLKHALRPCYAHFEWDPSNTPESWAQKAAEAGANCLIGVGEMPAGTVDGKLKAFGYDVLNRNPEFRFPDNYDLSYGWVKEFADAGHRHGLKVAVYGGAFRSLDPLLVEHPEWRQVDVNGRPYPNGFGSWWSPYRRAYVQRWADVAKTSGFDGIMIDMLFTGPPGGDYSSYTVEAFKQRFGVDPPTEPDPRNLVWQRWLDFQSWTREEMLLDLTEALHAVDPEIAVIINQTEGWIYTHGERNFLTTRVARCVDGLLEEMGWEYRHNWTRPWAWPLEAAWQNLFLHCRTRPGYGQMWHMILNYPAASVQSLSYSMLANGTAPAVVTGGNWPIMQDIWAHTKACEPWLEGAELVPWLGLHWGEDTLQWYADARGDEAAQAWLENVFGCFQAALELHLPIEILTDDDLADPAVLARYATLLLPNSACLSDAQAAAITTYVQGGGGLVASYETGRYDEDGTRRPTPALADLFGVTQYGPVQSSTWTMPLRDLNHPVVDDPAIREAGDWRQGWTERASFGYLYTGPAARTVGAVAVGPAAEGSFTVSLGGAGQQRPRGAPDDSFRYSAVVARQAEAGKVVCFPIDLGHAYYVFNHPMDRALLGNALRWTASRPAPLRTNALMKVQTVAWQQGDARIVHLVNDVSSFGRAAAPNPEAFTAFRSEVAPVHDTQVAVPGTFREALLLPSGDKLAVTAADGFSSVIVPRVDVHAMVVFQP